MTAIIGFLCQDGVVVGTDSAATSAAGNLPTIEQPVKKIRVVDDRVIIAGTGSVGLGQRFTEEVRKFNEEGAFGKNSPIDSARILARNGITNFATTHLKPGQYGALMAFPHGGKHHLVEFATNDFQPEFKSKDSCFVTMGNGQLITDSFVGFLRRVFFDGDTPTLSEGIFYTVWTLHQAIDLNTGGIKGPMQVAVLKSLKNDGQYKASILTEAELSEHIDHIRGVEKHLGEYRKIMSQGRLTPPIPELKG